MPNNNTVHWQEVWNSNSRLSCTHVTDGTCARSMASSKIIPFFSCSSVSVLQNINQGSAGMDSVQGIKTQSCYPGLGGAIYELSPNLAFPYGSVFSPACPQQTSLNYPEGVRKDMVCLILSHIFKLGLHIGAQNPHSAHHTICKHKSCLVFSFPVSSIARLCYLKLCL